MHVRAHTLVLQMIIRVYHLPDDCLLAKLVPFITAAPIKNRFRWPALLRQNPLWSNPQYTGGYTSVDDRLAHLSTDAHVKQSVLAYRKDLLHRILNRPDPPVLLSACRPSIGIDGMFFIPMLLSDRSRILRWRMGWLPARPIDSQSFGSCSEYVAKETSSISISSTILSLVPLVACGLSSPP
ncbi:hypothetical protein G6F63_013587 [Rhizopus arrhizus]|nr:hypothetical protein G6F63_013587 [Rhizopus arrhizus]